MALKLNLPVTNVGIPCPEAYARIVAFSFDTKSGECVVSVDIYATAAAREAGASPVSGGVFKGTVGVDFPTLDDTLPGIRSVLYGWLKTQPGFETAEDC